MKPTSEITLKITIKDNHLRAENIYEEIKSMLKEDYHNSCSVKCLSKKDFRPKGNFKDLEDGDIECDSCGNSVHTSFDYIKTEEKDGIPYDYYKCLLCGHTTPIWDIFYEKEHMKEEK